MPYEWWIEGGDGGLVEAGRLAGVVRVANMDPDRTIYTLRHNYNDKGRNNQTFML